MPLTSDIAGNKVETKPQPEDQKDVETIETLAHDLAQRDKALHQIDGTPLPSLVHVEKLQEALHKAYLHFTKEAQDSLIISYGGEWLINNYYIIQRSVQQIKENMPPNYYKRLLKIGQGSFVGYPQVYVIAHTFNHFLKSRLTINEQNQFIKTYQEHTALNIGELWAWPTMLRITLLENLIIALDQSMERNGNFIQGLVPSAIQDHYPLNADEDTIIANCVTSLRAIDAYDWSEFVEDFSQVEAILQQDPSGIYPIMDFDTRDRYRQMIEKLSSSCDQTEQQVAHSVLELAQQPEPDLDVHKTNGRSDTDTNKSNRTSHIGYYLIDEGLAEVKEAIGYRDTFREAISKRLSGQRLAIYLIGIWLVAALLLIMISAYATASGGTVLQVLAIVLLLFVPSISVATYWMNWIVSRIVPPRLLPKMDYSEGIPDDYSSIVAIPTLLTSIDEVTSLANQLEQHYLRNTDSNLYYTILADYVDADQEVMPEDDALLDRAKVLLQDLNTKYGDNRRKPFLFFLRKRQWNESEGKWMGYERKRGKLAEFNRLILNPDADTSYSVKLGDLHILNTIRYVITLDSDTILPQDGARRLVGTMAHPLNQASFDESGQHVRAGYTVLQPRVDILPTAANQTPFTRIYAGERGLDLYTLAVSDVYQDLFGEGIYVGKGIYDVVAFEQSLEGRTPENSLLSHDLFEGLHGRAGLVTDIVLLEDYPTHYLAYIDRVHRWVRGDWQLLPWLLPNVPTTDGERTNTLSLLDKWKILDNLIRSLLQPTLVMTIVLSWFWLPSTAIVWTVFAVSVLFVPYLIAVINQVSSMSLRRVSALSYIQSLSLSLTRWSLHLVLLPYEALVHMDAIYVTLRRLRKRKNLLEWKTAASVVRLYQGRTTNLIQQRMANIVILVTILALIAFILQPNSILVSLPLIIAWLGGPILAERISQPIKTESQVLTDKQRQKLKTLSRRTWLFFEEFVGPNDHWLPPDHYQQTPINKVGHYTSPTNIGLMLVSVLGAYDQGYIGLLDMMTRLQFSFESLSQLERYRGHLLNWYSTKTLSPMSPRYVSTVDNGNFAACLMVLQSTFNDFSHTPFVSQQLWQGITDTLHVLEEILEDIEPSQSDPLITEIKKRLATMCEYIASAQEQPELWVTQLEQLTHQDWDHLSTSIVSLSGDIGETEVQVFHDLHVYLSRLKHHLDSFRRDLDMLAPWLTELEQAPPYLTAASSSNTSQLWSILVEDAKQLPTFDNADGLYHKINDDLTKLRDTLDTSPESKEAHIWCEQLQTKVSESRKSAQDLIDKLESVQQTIHKEFHAMDFGFLYDNQRHLFHIGYNIDAEQLDNSYYDMFASEARIASFISIAKRDVPQKHWLHLSRPVTLVDNVQTLMSWSGTMFEYLMPLLFMRDYPNTLLHQSYKAVVEHQINFGQREDVPWGVSESGYYAFDSVQNYQYRAFGLPTLGYKRDQAHEVVIAPYASVLALPIAPTQVVDNIQALTEQGALTTYGLMEAVDYTTSRLRLGRSVELVTEYMAHHHGMIFISLANYLNNDVMVERFHRNPIVESAELLLMEKMPIELSIDRDIEEDVKSEIPLAALATHPWEINLDMTTPQAHYLSNGKYSVMITSNGAGYSQWDTRAVTRWQADTTLDNWGQWLYLYEESSNNLWSPTLQPLGHKDQMNVTYHLSHVEFQSRANAISSQLKIMVPPEHDLEIRKLTLTNHNENDRTLSICSYGEMVLAPQNTDQRHQAFNKMFIESEFLPELDALLFRRRPRAVDDSPMYVLHMLISPDEQDEDVQFDTDRKHFIGRNGSHRDPAAFHDKSVNLSGAVGSTLDPIMAIAQSFKIPAHSTVQLAYITLSTETREEALTLASRYRAWDEIDRAENQSRYNSERELRDLGINTDDISRFQRLLSSLLYPNPRFRAPSELLASNTKSQSGLWAYGVSGDYPIVLVQINNEDQLELVREMVIAHRFWRNRGFSCTLVILNQTDTGYMQELYNQLHRLLVRTGNENWLNRHDGIYILRSEQMDDADRILLQSASRVVLSGKDGTLQQILDQKISETVTLPSLMPSLDPQGIDDTAQPIARPNNLLFDNAYGGFSEDGHEYQIYVDKSTKLPAPWINVIANPHGGFIVSEAGSGFTWSENSGEHRLTTWRNDPVIDMPSEAIYLRDEESALVWSPTPMPVGTKQPYLIRHGAGYSVFEHQSYGLTQTTQFYMAPDAMVKFVNIRLKNTTSRPRRITATYYMEWVLGPLRDMTQQYLIPEYDSARQTLLAHNPYSMEFSDHHAFITADKPLHGWTADRTEFLGNRGSLSHPIALSRIGLNSNAQAGIDTCAVVQLHIDLPANGEEEICFVIGSAGSHDAALELSQKFSTREQIDHSWHTTRKNWRDILDSIVIRTPDKAMNLLLPWLLYQALSCRIWGRSALYQSSGAFGFRDQLQDVMALIHVRPDLVREHILRAAKHQFEEGDVLHWWHPPSGRGVRTRFSDDLVWLPFVVSHYVNATGDDSILSAEVSFLKGEVLRPEEEERYGFYESTSETYSIYEHCRRSLNKAFSLGQHDLPLMKAGDWNDGMNRVGIEGRGESVWMGWFLYMTIEGFLDICPKMDDALQAETYQQWLQTLKTALENEAWDGEWYRRAYFDDGTPLGSIKNDECQIDSLPQSWGVLSGAADKERVETAMNAVEERLIQSDDQLIQLFAPPFNNTPHDPGYIKGYPPGIRENGGQYTHAALWVVWAFAEMGRGTTAESLFRLLNPIYHSDTHDKAEHYMVEPYVVAADVYSTSPHTGRGGWTWYTGSSGWMYRLGIEAILGLYREGNNLRIDPRTNAEWKRYEVDYRYGDTTYHIAVLNPDGAEIGVQEIQLDGHVLESNLLPLVDDGFSHDVKVLRGTSQ